MRPFIMLRTRIYFVRLPKNLAVFAEVSRAVCVVVDISCDGGTCDCISDPRPMFEVSGPRTHFKS